MRTLLLLVLLTPAECEDLYMPLSEQTVQILSAFKPGSTPRAGILTLLDPDLQVPVAADVAYAVDAFVIVRNPGAVAGFRWTWLVPTHIFGAISMNEIEANVGANAGLGVAGAWAAIGTLALPAGDTHFRFMGTLIPTPGNPGQIRFTWGQRVNDPANPTSVIGGSWLRAHRLGP